MDESFDVLVGGETVSVRTNDYVTEYELEKQRESQHAVMKRVEAMRAVWLYGQDAEASRVVDEAGPDVRMFSYPRMQNTMGLACWGEDYAKIADADLASQPFLLADRAIGRVPDEGRRNAYRDRFNALAAPERNADGRDYYALYAEVHRDEMRHAFGVQRQVQKNQAARVEAIVRDTLAGKGDLLSPDDFLLLQQAGINYEDLSLAGYVASAARAGATAEQQADVLWERNASSAARRLALQQIAADALEKERQTGEQGFFENMIGRFAETGEAIEETVKSMLPSERNMLYPELMKDSEGRWLDDKGLSERVTNRAAWRSRVQNAVEESRGKARDELGFRVSSMPANLASGLVRLAPWMVPTPAAKGRGVMRFLGQGLVDSAAQAGAMGGLLTDSLSKGFAVQQEAAEDGVAIGDVQVAGKAMASTFAGAVPMFGGSWLVRNGVGRLLPQSMTWGARALSKAPVAYGANAAASTFTFGAGLPAVEYGLNAAYDVAAFWQDERLDTGLRDLVSVGQQMGTGEYWAEQGLLGAVLGVPGTGATRLRARRYLGDLKGALSEGVTRRQFESTIFMEPQEQLAALEKFRRENIENDAEGSIKAAVREARDLFDRERAVKMRADEAIKAAMEEFGFSVEDAGAEGMVSLYYGGEVLPDGSFKRGEGCVTLSREEADVYLQACIGYKLEGVAHLLRHAAGNKRLLDAFREELKGEVKVEWLREADVLAKYERWKEQALERIETRARELEAEGVDAGKARKVAEDEVHADISVRGTLGELVRFATNMRERAEQEAARMGVPIDAERFGSRANVTRARTADARQLRRVLRLSLDAGTAEIAEELGEQVMFDWRESNGMSVTEAFRYLKAFAQWAKKSSNPGVAKAAKNLLSLEVSNPGLARRVMSEGFNEADLTVDEYRAVERELTEAGSLMMLSELRQAAADGNMPMWARGLFDMADLSLLELERDMNLAMALQQAREEGVLPEVAQKLFGVGREAVEAVLREEPKAQEYHVAWFEVQRRQSELDAAYGAGKLTEPSITEEFEARARQGQEALERERVEDEMRAAEAARERLEEFKSEPENEGKSHAVVVKEVAERAADAAEERMRGEPGAEKDADFVGGLCLEISDESGLVCKSGLLDVGHLKLLPNFKLGADKESGVVHPLKGDYRPDHDPIRVWRKNDGELLVISGRHRLDAAKRAGATRIAAYVYDEGEVRDLTWARRYDIESNIRDNQATPLEVALYVRGEFSADGKPLSNEEVERAGITREGKLGSIGFRIGRRAGEALMEALRNGKVDDRVALWIADFCPGNDAVQRRGLEVALGDGSKAEVQARMEAELAKQQMQEELGLDGGEDLFGNALDNDEFMDFVARYVLRRRNELAQDAGYLNATAKKRNAEAMGRKYGVDVKDPAALKKRLAELNALRERWKSPYSDGELMDEICQAWRGREGVDVPADAVESRVEAPSERLFREFSARVWQAEGVDYSFTDDAGNLRNLSRAYATDAQGNRLEKEMYITTPQGNLDWYKFPQDEKTQKLLAAHRVKNLPIRLKVGKQESQEHRGFGFLHILNHYDDLMTIGESPLLHLYNTLSNLVKIRGGNGGRYQFKGEYEGGRDSLLIAQLLEDEGCYSMISCYPTQMNRRPQRGELVIGRVLFQFIPSSGEYQIQASKTPSETTTSSVSTSGQVSAEKVAEKTEAVNIYDVRIKDKDGEFFRQQYEPTVHFSVIGPNAATWDKYRDRMFTGRDDGMLRAEIDVHRAKIKDFPKVYPVYDVMRKLVDAGAYDSDEYMVYSSLKFIEDITDTEKGEKKLDETELKEDVNSTPDLAAEVEHGLKAAGLTWQSDIQAVRGACFTALSKWKKKLEEELKDLNIEKPSGEAWHALVEQKPGLASVNSGKRIVSAWSGKWLDDVLDFPELFEAYPQLRNIQLAEDFGLALASASYSEFAARHGVKVGKNDGQYPLGFINMNPKDSTWSNARKATSLLLHEIQHAIQDIEGFAKGANARNGMDAYMRSAGEIEARNVEKRLYWSAAGREATPFNDTLEYPGEAIVTHYSICGMRAKTANEYLEKGADYVDPADGQRKFVIPVRGARLRSDVTPGMLNVAAGGHKDVSLAALLHYPELYRAYPQLAEMRVRLYRPVEEAAVGGYFSVGDGEQAAFIAVNVQHRALLLSTLLHESQHAIQRVEGFAIGAGSFEQNGALAYIDRAIEQRRRGGLQDDWSRDNLAFLEGLRGLVLAGDEMAIRHTYWVSHGEQEARFTGEGFGAEGGNPMDDSSAEPLMKSRPSSYTVAVQQNATDLGGVTFLNMGRFGYLLDERLMPAGEFHYDRRVYQMRENVMRRVRELRSQSDGSEEADGLRLAAEGLAVMDSIEALLPNTYRAALEPYKVYFNTFAKLRGSGDAAKAADTVPMMGWDARMFSSFYGMVFRLISGKAEAAGEFWEHAFRDVPGAEEGLEAMRAVWGEVHEQVEAEYGERLADAPNARERNKIRSLIESETFNRLELMCSEEMKELFQALGSMRADKLMAKFLERVALQLDAFRKDTTLGRIRRVVDALTPLPGKDGKPVKGRMAAESYNKVQDMLRLLELTKGQVLAFERTRYTGKADCPDGCSVWAELEPEAQLTVETYDADGEAVVVTCTKQEYETYACFDGMTAAQAECAGKALGEFITTGRQAWENMEELRRQRVARMCTPLMEGHAETLNDERRRKQLEKRGVLPMTSFARKVHAVFGSWMNDAQFFDAMTGVKEVEGFARDFTDRMARAKVYIESKEKERRATMLDAVFEASGAKSGKDAREFIDYINRTERTGVVLRAQEPDFLAQEMVSLRAQFLGLLRRKTQKKNFSPNTFAAMMKYLEAQGEEVIPTHILEEALAKYGEIGDAKKSRLHGVDAMAGVLTQQEFERFRSLTKAAKKRADKARVKWLEEKLEKDAAVRLEDEDGLELTRSEAAYRVLLCEQADYEETLRRQGYTEAVVGQLRVFAGEKMMRLAYRLRDELGARTPQIKEVYERVYGVPFPEVENYFRAYFDAGYEVHSEAIMGGAGEGRAAGKGTSKFLYTRHHHNAKIDPTMNVLTAFECAMKEQDIMLGYEDLPMDISSVLNYRDGDLKMSDALAKVFSSHTVGEMKLIADNMTRAVPVAEETARWMTRCLSVLGSSTATAVLNYRMGTLFKQGTALFNTLAGSDRVSWREWHKAAFRVNLGLGKISPAEMAARPELDGRFKGWAASVHAEALLGDADVISAKGATDAAARAGMSLMEWIDMRANVRACATLYDAVYRKTQKENPGLTHAELDADAMNEVRRALAFKSQPLDWRSRALLGGKKSLFSIGNLFLGGESINTMGNVLRLMARGKKGDWGKAAYVWLEHGLALQMLTAVYNWMTDDEEQWERRSWQQYVAGSVLGPLAGLPVVSAFVGAGTGVFNTFLPKEARVWMPSQSLLPMADVERVVSDLRKVLRGKKASSWQDKVIAVDNFIRVLAMFGIMASHNPTTAGGARVKALSYSAAAVTNILDFLLRTSRALEERAFN